MPRFFTNVQPIVPSRAMYNPYSFFPAFTKSIEDDKKAEQTVASHLYVTNTL